MRLLVVRLHVRHSQSALLGLTLDNSRSVQGKGIRRVRWDFCGFGCSTRERKCLYSVSVQSRRQRVGLLPLEDQSGGTLAVEDTLWGLHALNSGKSLSDLAPCRGFGIIGRVGDRGSGGAGVVVELPQLSDRQGVFRSPVER